LRIGPARIETAIIADATAACEEGAKP